MPTSDDAALEGTGSHRQTRRIAHRLTARDDQRDKDSTPGIDDSDQRGDRAPAAGDECPVCGREIAAITALGPSAVRASPCGHRIAGVRQE